MAEASRWWGWGISQALGAPSKGWQKLILARTVELDQVPAGARDRSIPTPQKRRSLENRGLWGSKSALPLFHHVNLHKLLQLFELQFPHL